MGPIAVILLVSICSQGPTCWQNQCILMAYCFDLGVVLPGSIFANVKAPLLSSRTVVFILATCCSSSPTPLDISSRSSLNGKHSFSAIDSALYSASIVESAMLDCSLLCQIIGQPAIQTTNPVRLFTQDGSVVSSYDHNPAKLAST